MVENSFCVIFYNTFLPYDVQHIWPQTEHIFYFMPYETDEDSHRWSKGS